MTGRKASSSVGSTRFRRNGLGPYGYRPSNHTADALLYTMRNGGVEANAKLNTSYTGTPDPGRLTVGALEFQMSEPMSKWRLLLRGRDEVDLTWTALHAPFDFHTEAPPRAIPAVRLRRCAHGAVRTGHRQRKDERSDLRN